MVLGFGKKSATNAGAKPSPAKEKILTALATVHDPVFDYNVVNLGMIIDVEDQGGKTVVHLELPTFALTHREALERDILERATEAAGHEVVLNVTANVKPSHGAAFGKMSIPGIQNVVLIASGKGGVGKSTVASNFAAALSSLGCRVGLLDADVYGPSVPTMFGIADGSRPGTMPGESPDKPVIVPLDRHGVKLMSMGFLVDTSTPMVWRGPMIASAAMQLFRDVAWGELDYLVVDLPPGTGDVQLTIAQQVAVTGAVVVSTPQDVALADVIRAKAMFDKVSIPSIGVVENMSWFECDGCGKRHEIFTHGGAKAAAERLGVPFLCEIPLEIGVREGGDDGTPVVIRAPETGAAKAFLALAKTVATKLAKDAQALPEPLAGPSISISGGAPSSTPAPKKGGLPIIS